MTVNEVLLHVPQRQGWLAFRQPVEVLAAAELRDVLPVLAEIEHQTQQNGKYAAGFLTYESAPAFDPAFQVNPPAPGGFPLIWFGLYGEPEFLPGAGLQAQGSFPMLDWQPQVTLAEYRRAIRRIKKHIAHGETYQVNYTYRLHSPWEVDPLEAFSALAAAQRAPYAAFLQSQDWAICSISPELFFTLDDQVLTSKPMKGTAQRGLLQQDDLRLRDWLHASQKNRAENVMIVDMVRNDMGHIARVGSVQVPHLFSIEKYPTVWQMTSTVQAQTGASLAEILQALFPCASITGAPKIHTMQIIKELESSPRQVYTGAIGFYAPGRQAQFNVPIRTLLIDKRRGMAEYSVGGGIVWDSKPGEEWQETQTKARILVEPPQPFDLLETLRWSPSEGWFLLDGHLQRLQRSADYFVYPFEREQVLAALEMKADELGRLPAGSFRVRLLLGRDGALKLEHQALDLAASPRKVGLARTAVRSDDRFLYHKTTRRQVYQNALAQCPDCEDVLLWNERDELTESAIANLAVELDGKLLTPPLSCGLLPGVYREWLLAKGKVQERVLHKETLEAASAIYLFNSLRGMWQVSLVAD